VRINSSADVSRFNSRNGSAIIFSTSGHRGSFEFRGSRRNFACRSRIRAGCGTKLWILTHLLTSRSRSDHSCESVLRSVRDPPDCFPHNWLSPPFSRDPCCLRTLCLLRHSRADSGRRLARRLAAAGGVDDRIDLRLLTGRLARLGLLTFLRGSFSGGVWLLTLSRILAWLLGLVFSSGSRWRGTFLLADVADRIA